MKFVYEDTAASGRGFTEFFVHGAWMYENSSSMGHGSDPVVVCMVPDAKIPRKAIAEYMFSQEYTASMAVISAIDQLKNMDPEYWSQTVSSRLKDGVGSRTSYSTQEELETALCRAEWIPYEHPDISKGCKAYITSDIKGVLGVEKIRPNYWYSYGSKDGKVFATLVGCTKSSVDFTIAIVGPDGDLWTFHPGEPVRPSQSTDLSLVGVTEQGFKAIERGFIHAKIADK